jgi:hypothetical protein
MLDADMLIAAIGLKTSNDRLCTMLDPVALRVATELRSWRAPKRFGGAP